MKNNYCTFYIVRHGETDWNVKKLLMGQTDVPLNKKGESQAEELGKKLTDVHFDAAFSSDLARARRTAELITLEKKLTVQTTKVLRERHFGRLEGESWETPRKEVAYLLDKIVTLSEKDKRQHRLEDVEDDEEIIARFIPYLREIAVGYQGKNVLIVSHGGVMRVLLVHLGYIDSKKPFSVSVHNTSYVKLESDGVDFFINETHGIEKINP